MKPATIVVRPWSLGMVLVELIGPSEEKAMFIVHTSATVADPMTELDSESRLAAIDRARQIASEMIAQPHQS